MNKENNTSDKQKNGNDFIADVRHCAFQYYNGRKMVSDKHSLTLEEAKELWNEYYADMVENTTDGEEIEVAIWINMQNDSDYRETLVHFSSPEIRNGKLYEPKYYDLF
jgi:hypothetical protein